MALQVADKLCARASSEGHGFSHAERRHCFVIPRVFKPEESALHSTREFSSTAGAVKPCPSERFNKKDCKAPDVHF